MCLGVVSNQVAACSMILMDLVEIIVSWVALETSVDVLGDGVANVTISSSVKILPTA